MKKLLIIISALGILSRVAFTANPPTDWQEETKRIAQMSEALQKQTIEEFMKTAHRNHWGIPRIPSKWFVDTHVIDEKEKRYLQSVRDFGYQLVLRLEDLAKEQQTLPQDDSLFQRTLLLCDLGGYFTEVAGYGNFFLAQRCIDLSAVGLARLTASMDFPLGKCEELSERMRQEWQEMPYRVQMLNGEANTNIFINTKMNSEQLDDIWGIGSTMQNLIENQAWRTKREEMGWLPPSPPSPRFVNVGAFTNNLHFFAEPERSEMPQTLSRSWDCRQHRHVIFGGGWAMARNQALALLKYRSVVGFFPPPFVRSKEEIMRRDAEIEEYAKLGIAITKAEDSPTYDPLEEAFRRELQKLEREKAEKCDYSAAFIVYKTVANNSFVDSDTAEIQSSPNR